MNKNTIRLCVDIETESSLCGVLQVLDRRKDGMWKGCVRDDQVVKMKHHFPRFAAT